MSKFEDLEYGVSFCLERIDSIEKYEEISAEMKIMRDDILKLISKGEDNLSSIKKYKDTIAHIIRIAQSLYNYSGYSTGLTDTEYDKLYDLYIALGGKELITVKIPDELNRKTTHHKYITLRGTLSKVYYLKDEDKDNVNKSRKSLSEWVKSKTNLLRDNDCFTDLWDSDVYVFPKWDGVSCIFEFDADANLERALTRGDTERNEAQDITNAVENLVRGKKTENGYGLKTEIMMSEDDLAYYNDKYHTKYKNTRSIVSAILNSDSVDERNELLHIVPLRTTSLDEFGEEELQELAPEVLNDYPFIQCKLSEVDKIETFAINHRYVDGLRCDGVVIYIIDKTLRNILGRDGDKNNYEVAYKFTEENGITTVEDIDFRMGLFGNVTPVVSVKPIKLKGNTIRNVSISNYERFNNLNLSKGDEVRILYDIVPYLVVDNECKKSTKPPIEFITHCPECGGKIEISDSNKTAKCINPKCRCLEKGKILNFINKLDIRYIDERTLESMYNADVIRNIKDLYTFTKKKKKLEGLDGIGEITIKNIAKSVKEKSHKVEIYRLLGAIGIPGVGVGTFKTIFQVLTYEELIDACINDKLLRLSNIKGISDITARKVIDGVNDNIELIEWLVKKLNPTYSTVEANAKFTVAFTKVRDDELEKLIRERGGVVTDTVTKSTKWLVVPSLDTKSSKVSKAEKYGTLIITCDSMKNLMNIGTNKFSDDIDFNFRCGNEIPEIKSSSLPSINEESFNILKMMENMLPINHHKNTSTDDKSNDTKKKGTKKKGTKEKVIDFFKFKK